MNIYIVSNTNDNELQVMNELAVIKLAQAMLEFGDFRGENISIDTINNAIAFLVQSSWVIKVLDIPNDRPFEYALDYLRIQNESLKATLQISIMEG